MASAHVACRPLRRDRWSSITTPPGPVQLGLIAAGVGTTMAHHSVSFHGAAMASMASRWHNVGFHNTTTGRQWHSSGIDKRQPDDGELGSRCHGTRSRLKSFFRKLIFRVGWHKQPTPKFQCLVLVHIGRHQRCSIFCISQIVSTAMANTKNRLSAPTLRTVFLVPT
jgi:hypothetical protein